MKNQSPDTHRSQIESLLNPLTMSETDKESERRGRERETHTHTHTHKQREREIERCKMERITNECAAEREP